MPKPVTEEDILYICDGELPRHQKRNIQVPIRDVENEISNILSTVWINVNSLTPIFDSPKFSQFEFQHLKLASTYCFQHESDIKVLQAKRRKIMANFGAADFDSLFEDTE
ncbi:unnamed protein product [Hydatigera taeniaeformis]|uniref:Phage protein n=1 Tax=Hydatigena taeniaeformis TaxID=6205 RepID=A0A0R3X435_HYDTA|nr:unnamed protein product [Hydatigera taeniaeformis]